MLSVLQFRSLFRSRDEEQNWAEGASMWNVRIESVKWRPQADMGNEFADRKGYAFKFSFMEAP